MIDAKETMMDRIGVTQHHDAVTGTGKQAVADDYSWKLFTGMEINDKIYTKQIADRIEKTMGVKSNST